MIFCNDYKGLLSSADLPPDAAAGCATLVLLTLLSFINELQSGAGVRTPVLRKGSAAAELRNTGCVTARLQAGRRPRLNTAPCSQAETLAVASHRAKATFFPPTIPPVEMITTITSVNHFIFVTVWEIL